MMDVKNIFSKINKDNLPGLIAFGVLLIMLVFELFIPQRGAAASEEMPDLPVVNGAFHTEFPCSSDEIVFNDGWLGQSEGENYRWVRKKSAFYVALSDQEKVSMSGYVPADINVSKVTLYLNGKKIAKCRIGPDQGFTLEGNIAKQKKTNSTNKFEVVFNAERVPSPDDADQRMFSAMFMTIDIE